MKIKFTIKGNKVHDVGYRVFLVNKALSVGVVNFLSFNTFIEGIQVVIAIIEANNKNIEDFQEFIKTTAPDRAEVECISIEEYKKNIPPIETCMQAYQMEQCSKGIRILEKIVKL